MLDTIRNMKHRDPFLPFRITLTNGERYDVENPDLIALLRAEIFYAYPRSNRWAFLRLNQIASVETLNGDSPHESSNGSR